MRFHVEENREIRRSGCEAAVLTRSKASCTMSSAAQEGRLAQLVRAPALQAGGRRFESCTAHQIRHRTVIMVMSPESRARRIPYRGTAIRASGVVVQLVRTLPCHGRGRGFESSRHRHHSKALMEWWPENPDPQSSPQSLDSIGLHPQLRQERSLRGLCFLPVVLRVEI